MGMKEGEQIEHPWLTKAIASAQKKVEAHNFDIRKNLLEYDDVMNQQRRSVYKLRRMVLGVRGRNPGGGVRGGPQDQEEDPARAGLRVERRPRALPRPGGGSGARHGGGELRRPGGGLGPRSLQAVVKDQFGATMKFDLPSGRAQEARHDLEEQVFKVVEKLYGQKEEELGKDAEGTPVLRRYEQYLYLQAIDQQWKDHLLSMDHLRQGIGLRGYGQKDPKQEYKKEGYEMFVQMTWRVKSAVVGNILRLQLVRQESAAEIEAKRLAMQRRALARAQASHAEAGADGEKPRPNKQETVVRTQPKVGRNDPCPCGSGKKYKKCHGATETAA